MTLRQPNHRARERMLDLPNGHAEIWLERSGADVTLHTSSSTSVSSESAGQRWRRCESEGCLGDAVIGGSKCLRHADAGNKHAYLRSHGGGTGNVSLRGVEIPQELLDEVLSILTDGKNRLTTPISFAGAELSASIRLDNWALDRWIDFTGAIILGSGVFRHCSFSERFSTRLAFFNGGALSFIGCTFAEDLDLSYTHVERTSIAFTSCTFGRSFTAAGLNGPLLLTDCQCQADFVLRGADAPVIVLERCFVGGDFDAADIRCQAFRAPYLRAPIAHQLGPLTIENDCALVHAQFGARVRLQVQSGELDLSGAQLLGGGHVLLIGGDVILGQLATGGALRISGVPSSGSKPTILGLQDADAGLMSFAHVDMSRCVFYGAHDLGGVVIEPTVQFAVTHSLRHTRRRCIADEFAWRLHTGGIRAWGWQLAGTAISGPKPGDDGNRGQVVLPALRASQVAAVYRDLRRSFEARADEPGAADFYYGEMEMRRHSREPGLAERGIIWLYWILSGYGLRAWRAFAWLAALVVVAGLVMADGGFAERCVTRASSFIFAIRAVLPGVHSQRILTVRGEIVEIVLALVGPVLFALALLALRGRVRR